MQQYTFDEESTSDHLMAITELMLIQIYVAI